MELDNQNAAPDVNEEVSSEPQAEAASEASKEPAIETKTDAEKYVPYDRFQEIIQQKNESSKQFEELSKRYRELEGKFNEFSKKPEPQTEDSFVQALKGINPEWAKSYQEVLGLKGLKKELEELKSWKSMSEQERNRSLAVSTLEKLQTEHKVDKFWHDNYIARLKDIDSRSPLSLDQLPSVYKKIHDEAMSYLEGQKRNALGQYTTAKKADASIPAAKKGEAPKAAPKKFEYSKDREEAMAQVVKRALDQSKAHRDS